MFGPRSQSDISKSSDPALFEQANIMLATFSVAVAKAQVCTSDQTEGCKRFLAHQYSECLFNNGVTVS